MCRRHRSRRRRVRPASPKLAAVRHLAVPERITFPEKEEEKVKEAKILPPPQADSVHQVLLRLHLLDAGLAYA